jgi:hypothetical protein
LVAEDRAALLVGVGRPVDIAAARSLDQHCGVATQRSVLDLPAEEVLDDRQVFVVGARCSGAPERVDVRFEAFCAGGRLEVLWL